MRKRGTLLVIAFLVVAQVLVWRTGSAGSGGSLRIDTHQVPMRMGDWQGRSMGSLDDVSQEMLEPDAVIARAYRDQSGGVAELLVVYGHKKATFHSPGQCLLGGGWSIVSKQRMPVTLGDGSIVINRFIIQKGERRSLVFYGYAEGRRFTPSWVKHQVLLARARARGQLPAGALVRIMVPVVGDQAGADRVGVGLVQAALPGILRSLQTARQP